MFRLHRPHRPPAPAARPVRRPAPGLSLVLALLTAVSVGCSIVNQELPNEPPKLQVSQADTTRVGRGGVVSLQVQASDEDDDPLIFHWSAFGAGTFTDSTKASTQWIAPPRIDGHSVFYLILVTISDQQPETEDIQESFLIEVVQSRPALAASADTTASFREPAIALGATASDEDDDPLTFAWEILEGVEASLQVESPAEGISRALILPLYPGQVRVRVAVTDGADTVSAEIQISVVAAAPPEGGMVAVERPSSTGGVATYEMDVYEYPNQRGATPLLAESWFEAARLCAAQGKRLCSPVEWENACRGPEGGEYSSSDNPDALPASFGRRFCNWPGSEVAGDQPVDTDLALSGSFPNCSSSVGVFDLVGNAQEWVERVAPFGVEAGRFGRAVRSGATFPGGCGALSSEQAALPLADELDIADEAAIDSLRQTVIYQPYFLGGVGFRCCR